MSVLYSGVAGDGGRKRDCSSSIHLKKKKRKTRS